MPQRQPAKPSFPKSVRTLRPWLTDTAEGRRLLAKLTEKTLEEKCRACQQPFVSRPKVLVVVRMYGGLPSVEVFKDKGVMVRILETVDTPDDDRGVIESLVERLVVLQLPKGWRHLVRCARRSTASRAFVFRGLTAARCLESMEKLLCIRALGEWREEWDREHGTGGGKAQGSTGVRALPGPKAGRL